MSPTSYQLLHPATESLIIRQRLCVSSGKKEKTRKKKNSFSALCPPPQNEAPPIQPARPQPHRRPKAWALRKHRKSGGRIIARLARLSKPRVGRPGGGTLAIPPRRAAPRFLRRKATIAPTAKGSRRAGRADRPTNRRKLSRAKTNEPRAPEMLRASEETKRSSEEADG